MINFFKKLLYTFSIILTFFFIFNLNVSASSSIKVNGVIFDFTGSVWNGAKVVKTYDSELNSPFIGYTSFGNNSLLKFYFGGSAMININNANPEDLTNKRYMYIMEVCSTVPLNSTYTIANSGDGSVIETYPIINSGSCNMGVNGTKYRFPVVLQFDNPSIGTIYWNGTILIDFNNGYSSTSGSYAVTGFSVAEYTDELKNQFEQIAQSNTMINQNNTIINQNQTEINQNQTIIDQNNATNNKLDNIDDTMNNSSVDNPSGKFNEFENFLPENGVITQLITLPISLFQKVLNSINGSCSEYNLGNLLGTNLKLPCINISNYIGSTIWNVIDILFSGFFVLTISKKMIKTFNSFSSMEEGDVLD